LSDVALASVIFGVTYAAIVSERIHKTAAALAGGVAMIAFGIVDQKEAFDYIDFNVIFLLVGMMIIANTLGKTGALQWLAIRSAKLARGSPILITITLAVITAVFSAFLDNVTTVVLMAPLALFVAGILRVNPIPLLVTQIVASNIGGAATIIGDPPNILIGSQAELSFVDFLIHLGPIVLLVLGIFLAAVYLVWRHEFKGGPELAQRILRLDESEVLTDRTLMWKSLGILSLVVIFFVLHSALDIELATVALGGAAALMIISGQHPHEVLREVEWITIFFFVGLFMVVAGVEEAGVLEDIGEALSDVSGGEESAATMLVLWPSAFLSGVVGNIPLTTAMIPVVEEVSAEQELAGSSNPLWWALALGAGLGANLTVVAAAANVYVLGIAERAGYKVTFFQFMRYGALITIISLAVATGYLWLRYLL
jgi:Na+/H+ antiporter NhaD/arsenite permease-like protein